MEVSDAFSFYIAIKYKTRNYDNKFRIYSKLTLRSIILSVFKIER